MKGYLTKNKMLNILLLLMKIGVYHTVQNFVHERFRLLFLILPKYFLIMPNFFAIKNHRNEICFNAGNFLLSLLLRPLRKTTA